MESPYFNLRQDLIRLFDLLCREKAPEKATVWAETCPGERYDDTRMRLLMSYLNRLLETFLLVQEIRDKEDPLRLAIACRNRGLTAQYERNMRAFEREITKQPWRNVRYHSQLRDFQEERHHGIITQNPTDTESLRTLAYHTDVAYLTHRLRLICLELAQRNVYRAGDEDPLHRVVTQLAERPEWSDLPGIATYRMAARMLAQPEENKHFLALKQILKEVESVFSTDEMRELYMFCINHCIRRANSGERQMENELLQLYRQALEAGHLFENGLLSRFTYHNIVAAGLRCGELNWVAQFIQQYNRFLEEKYRDSSLNFNQARLDYARKRFDSVLTLLQKANYRDPLLNLAAKTLLLKTYYDQGEYDLLQSHLDAMRNYIHRKKVIGYHRTNYLNIIRFTERMLYPEILDRPTREALRREIEQETVLTEKEWLLGYLSK